MPYVAQYLKGFAMFKKEKIKDLHYNISGFLSGSEIQSAADEVLKNYGAKAKIPGFRPGHIPVSVLRQRYGDSAFGEAVDNLMNKDVENFVREKKLRLAGNPKADIVGEVKVGSDVEYTIEFDVLPSLPEIDLEKFSITKKVTEVPASEIEKSLENLRKSRAQAEKQPDSYKLENGDVAVIDFEGFLGDEAFEGGKASKHHLILGSGSFIPGFEEKIVGHKTGDEFDINIKFPSDYHSEKLAGADTRFAIKVHEARKHVLPELNDDLAKEVGQESVSELREHIKKILSEQYEEASKREMRNELLDLMADKIKLDVPENLVNQEFEMAKNEYEHAHAGHDHSGKDKGHAKFDEKQEHKDAERRVKLGLILADWGSQNGVSVTNEDLQRAIWTEASRYPDPSQVFDFYNKNQNALSMMRGMLFEQKALDAMITKVKVKEKSVKPEELFKQSEPK